MCAFRGSESEIIQGKNEVEYKGLKSEEFIFN